MKLTSEEQEIVNSFEKGEWVPVKNQAKAREEAMEAASNTLDKPKI